MTLCIVVIYDFKLGNDKCLVRRSCLWKYHNLRFLDDFFITAPVTRLIE